jgi:hypothetical protein
VKPSNPDEKNPKILLKKSENQIPLPQKQTRHHQSSFRKKSKFISIKLTNKKEFEVTSRLKVDAEPKEKEELK